MAHHADTGLVDKFQRTHKLQRIMQTARRIPRVVVLLTRTNLIALGKFANARAVGAESKYHKASPRQLYAVAVHSLVCAACSMRNDNRRQATFVTCPHRIVQFSI